MKNTYLLLAVLGFIGPNIFVAQETLESGNIMLWMRPLDTFQAMFANNVSSAFAVDLLLVVVVFMVWSYGVAKKHQLKGLFVIWGLTMLLGLSGTFPLFLYLLERKKEKTVAVQ